VVAGGADRPCYTKPAFGYEVRVIGENPDAAKYAGIDFSERPC
jgi:ABC-type uncharacterized transport system permease subunit